MRDRFKNGFLTLDAGFSVAAKAAIEEIQPDYAAQFHNYADLLTVRLMIFLETFPDLIGVQVTGADKYSVNVIAFFFGKTKYVYRIYDVCSDGSFVEVVNKSRAIFHPESGEPRAFDGPEAHQFARFAAHQHILSSPPEPEEPEEPEEFEELEEPEEFEFEELDQELFEIDQELFEIEGELQELRELQELQELEELEELEEPDEYDFGFCDLELFMHAHGKFMELRRHKLAKVPEKMFGALPYLPPRAKLVSRDAFDTLSYAGVIDLDLMEIIHRIDHVFLVDNRFRMMRVAAYYRAVKRQKAVSAYFAVFVNMSRVMFSLLRP